MACVRIIKEIGLVILDLSKRQCRRISRTIFMSVRSGSFGFNQSLDKSTVSFCSKRFSFYFSS